MINIQRASITQAAKWYISAAVALFAGGYSLLVLCAWYLRTTFVLQWRPDDAPAQFNAALGLLLCCAGLLLLRRQRLLTACGAALMLLGALTLAQYLSGVSLGIDTLLVEPYLTVQTSTPGRMAPNAALCLILTGAALLCIGAGTGAAIAGIAALISAAIAAIAAIGYLIDVEMAYGWFAATRLDFPTALALSAISACTAWHCRASWSAGPLLRWLWLPTMVVVACASITCTMWLSLKDAERQQLRTNTQAEIDRLIGQVSGAVANDLRSLEHMQGAWGRRGGMTHTEWRPDAAAIERDSVMLSAVFLVDRELHVKWAAPATLEQAVAGADLGTELDSLAALERARISQTPVFTHVMSSPQGGDGLMATLPLNGGGYVVGIFDSASLANVFAASRYAVQLYDGDQQIHSHADGTPPPPDLVRERSFALGNISWRVRMWPTTFQVARAASWQPGAVLATGLCMSLLLASITLLVQLAGVRARKLQREIAKSLKGETENALLISELEVVFANVVVGVCLVKDGRTVRCNTHYARLMGDPIEAIAGEPIAPGHPHMRIGNKLGREDGSCNEELELVRTNGTTFWAACSGKALDPADPSKGMVWVIEEITARKIVEEQLLHQAQHDALTGLANRTMFALRLDQALADAARKGHAMAVCYIDLDKFKGVNDTYGHAAGDHLLLTVAQRLTSAVRDSDTVARFGGDEFALVLTSAIELPIVAAVLDRILVRLQEDLFFNGQRLAVSASIGMAMYPHHGHDAQTLIKHADEAMYAAKQAGRNNWRAYTAPGDPHGTPSPAAHSLT